MVECDVIEFVGVSKCEIAPLMDKLSNCQVILDNTGVPSTRGKLGEEVEVVQYFSNSLWQ